jgi:hypothetical protein
MEKNPPMYSQVLRISGRSLGLERAVTEAPLCFPFLLEAKIEGYPLKITGI